MPLSHAPPVVAAIRSHRPVAALRAATPDAARVARAWRGCMRAMRRAFVALLLVTAWSGAAVASTEEFSTFDIARQEDDDESLIDHVLTRYPSDWRDEWEGSSNTFRTAQGCLTSGQWFMLHEMELRAPLGRRAWLDLELLQRVDNEAEYDWLQFEFRSPLWDAPGVWGFRFRPSFDKSRQDFALLWDTGTDSSRFQLHSVITLEDAFNKLWAFRQTQVGDRSQPYERHPFEPALRLVWRAGDAAKPPRLRPGVFDLARSARLEADAQWLTSGRQRTEQPDGTVLERSTLWGAKGTAEAQFRRGPAGAELRFENVQATSSRALPPFADDGRTFRRRWSGEVAANIRWSSRWAAEARWLYQDRTQSWRPPAGDGTFRALDRLAMAHVRWRPHADWAARAGIMRDRIGVATRGAAPVSGHGTRDETRIFLELQARFGRVTLRAVEGVELDDEPYEVSFHHDKGFLHLQTTF